MHTYATTRPWRTWPVATMLALAAAFASAQTSPTTNSTGTASATTSGSAGQPTSSTSAQGRLVGQYATLAGSTSNARSLVTGLNTGSQVNLSSSQSGTPPASFAPATGKLGLGEVNIALALAKTSLAQQGITNPTPAQLAAALNGGTISNSKGATVTLSGVLAGRASGQGWGQIAKSMGTTLGAVVSASKSTHAKAGNDHSRNERGEKSSGKEKSGHDKESSHASKDHDRDAASHHEAAGQGKSGASAGHGGGQGGGQAGGEGHGGGTGGGGAGAGGGGGGPGGGGGKR